ncbi:MAG: cation transporter, partial [Dehalococcoidia bacterium]
MENVRANRMAVGASSQETVELQVGGMDCASCVVAIESGLARVPGVDSVKVDLEAGRVLVGHRDAIQLDALERSIEDLGFQMGEGAGGGEIAAHRPFISPTIVFAALAVSLPLLILFRDVLPYMGGQNTLFTPGGLDTETFGEVQLIAVGIAFALGVAVFFSPGILAISSAVLGFAAG